MQGLSSHNIFRQEPSSGHSPEWLAQYLEDGAMLVPADVDPLLAATTIKW